MLDLKCKIQISCQLYFLWDLNMKIKFKVDDVKVITADAHTLGELDGAHLNVETWQITNLDVILTKKAIKELGLKKPTFGSLTVCLPVSNVKQFGDVVTLNLILKELTDLKECKTE